MTSDLVLKIEHDEAHSVDEYMQMIEERGKLNYFIDDGKTFKFTTNQTASYYVYSLEHVFVATLQVIQFTTPTLTSGNFESMNTFFGPRMFWAQECF